MYSDSERRVEVAIWDPTITILMETLRRYRRGKLREVDLVRQDVPQGIRGCVRTLRGWTKRTPAAKAGFSGVIYGTAEAVPFRGRMLTPEHPGLKSETWATHSTFVRAMVIRSGTTKGSEGVRNCYCGGGVAAGGVACSGGRFCSSCGVSLGCAGMTGNGGICSVCCSCCC